MKGIPYIVSAPSGAGKSTLCNMAVDFFSDLRHSISYTTRPPRQGEINGVEYHFIDGPAFERMAKTGEFLEYAGVHGKRYGTSGKDLEMLLAAGKSAMLDIDVQGAASIKKTLSNAVYIFILPPSLEVCEQRLIKRGKDNPEDIKRRVAAAREEINNASGYDYIIINDDLVAAFEKLKAIIIAESSKRERMAEKVNKAFGINVK
ncbi:guanylate kinase [bacterium]|nr:MAG: guanylate kinase [bacterium]